PQKALSDPGTSATVLVAFAVTAGRPAERRAGKVRSVPPPAMEFTTPARNAAQKSRMSSHTTHSIAQWRASHKGRALDGWGALLDPLGWDWLREGLFLCLGPSSAQLFLVFP